MIDKRTKSTNNKRRQFHPGKFLSSTLGTLVIILIAIISGIATGFLFFYLSMYIQARRASVVLPNYINIDSQRAEQELKEKGFKVVVIGERGKVIKMDPSPSVSVKSGREIKLFTENVKITKLVLPDFKYCWYKSVEQIMKELNINTSVKVVSGPGLYGTIVSTSPAPGNEIMSYQNIVLFVSSGKGDYENSQEKNAGREETSTFEATDGINNLGGAVEVVPPTVDLNTPTEQTIQPRNQENQPQYQSQPAPQPSLQETSTGSSEQAVEGGQF